MVLPEKTNIVLIGMPAAGKSTIGVLLAKILSMQFVDTDLLLQTEAGQPLQKILDQCGLEGFKKKEEEILLSLNSRNTVIATGGSAIYSESAMTHLAQNSEIIYIQVPLAVLAERLINPLTRGLVIQTNQSLKTLYQEREPYYARYANGIWDAGNAPAGEVAESLARKWFDLKRQKLG